jgi:hypothetical protein
MPVTTAALCCLTCPLGLLDVALLRPELTLAVTWLVGVPEPHGTVLADGEQRARSPRPPRQRPDVVAVRSDKSGGLLGEDAPCVAIISPLNVLVVNRRCMRKFQPAKPGHLGASCRARGGGNGPRTWLSEPLRRSQSLTSLSWLDASTFSSLKLHSILVAPAVQAQKLRAGRWGVRMSHRWM